MQAFKQSSLFSKIQEATNEEEIESETNLPQTPLLVVTGKINFC